MENQIEMCRDYLTAKFGQILESDIAIYEDEGFSAKNTHRPMFQKMLRDIRSCGIDCVVCYRLDRISRNVGDFATLIEELNRQNVGFICIREEFDTSKPMGKAMMYIASVFAQLERETIAERVRDNMRMLARSGRWLGGNLPTGFLARQMPGPMPEGKPVTALVPCPEEIQIVQLIYRTFLELHSVSGVGRHLLAQNIRSRSGRPYSLPGIREILSNPVYCTADRQARDYFVALGSEVCFKEEECSHSQGLMAYSKRDYGKKNLPRTGREGWIIALGQHPGVFPGKEWVLVQFLLEKGRLSPEQPRVSHNDYALLSGHIHCEKCGTPLLAKAHGNRTENGRFYYICRNKLWGGKGRCNSPNLPGPETDDAVCRCLLEHWGFWAPPKKRLEALWRETAPGIPPARQRRREINGELDNLVLLTAQSRDCSPEFLQRVNQRVKALIDELERIGAEDAVSGDEPQDRIAGRFLTLQHTFLQMDIVDKRALLQCLLQGASWDGTALHLYFYAP